MEWEVATLRVPKPTQPVRLTAEEVKSFHQLMRA
jgi:hypothetical protein